MAPLWDIGAPKVMGVPRTGFAREVGADLRSLSKRVGEQILMTVQVFLLSPWRSRSRRSSASAADFAAGSLVIPMDTDYQDLGMFARLRPRVRACCARACRCTGRSRPARATATTDFTASATDVASGRGDRRPRLPRRAVGDRRGRRRGALPIVEAWQQDNPDVAVHEASEGFTSDVARRW